MRRHRLSGGGHTLRYPQEPHEARPCADSQRSAVQRGGGLYDKSGQGRAAAGDKASSAKRTRAGGGVQQRQCEHLQCGRDQNRGGNVPPDGGANRRPGGGRAGCIYRRDRAAAGFDADLCGHGAAGRGAGSRRGAESGCGGGHHDDGHRAKVRRRGV